MDRYLLIIAIFACILPVVRCYPNGLVTASCIDMVPQHGVNSQQQPAPYSVISSALNFKEGDTITVTIQGNSSQFIGFLLQARLVNGTGPLGSFTVSTGQAQTLNCSGVSDAVSHTSSALKSSIQVTWTVPTSGSLNDIQFSATFVQNLTIYWVGVKSSTVKYTGTNGISSTGCGTSKVCFSQPANCDPSVSSACYFMSAVATSGDTAVQVEMTGISDGYIAIGFSDDQKMGNDDIYICGLGSNGQLQIQHAYSTGRSPPTILSPGNVSNVISSLNNGVISCSFTTLNPISTQRSIGSNSPYYLMLVYGSTSNGKIQIHKDTFVSSTSVNISSPGVVSTESFPPIVKAHGSLMLIAWMTTGSLGMIIAKYIKGMAKGTKCAGKDVWFVAHLSLMILTVAATSIAFILIFADVRDWSGGAHPVLGCIVMILTLIQPTAAIFRCGPTDKWRFIFNWSHALNALLIKVLAVAAIFTGLIWLDNTENQWLVKVMGGFVGWEALVYILLEARRWWKHKETTDEGSNSTNVELLILGLFFLGNLCFLVALLVGIGSQ
ncbi:hypothetical protein DPEC_G00074940 [Dallia pectoralis]|uniref:Uncharacterized protein n=1 Tax=Dallia pectoralis TaxID=75939 RepID=A0ACC2H3U4_DALPE|nr:hypothetical protein DPEC_G00074940 [Dallia pectoralis]